MADSFDGKGIRNKITFVNFQNDVGIKHTILSSLECHAFSCSHLLTCHTVEIQNDLGQF